MTKFREPTPRKAHIVTAANGSFGGARGGHGNGRRKEGWFLLHSQISTRTSQGRANYSRVSERASSSLRHCLTAQRPHYRATFMPITTEVATLDIRTKPYLEPYDAARSLKEHYRIPHTGTASTFAGPMAKKKGFPTNMEQLMPNEVEMIVALHPLASAFAMVNRDPG